DTSNARGRRARYSGSRPHPLGAVAKSDVLSAEPRVSRLITLFPSKTKASSYLPKPRNFGGARV
ncbi:MAG: hypothetical protein OQK92_14115, partial [Sedimenticola sp.]|nr:hypothetical protein [Sedimenticola sp.]